MYGVFTTLDGSWILRNGAESWSAITKRMFGFSAPSFWERGLKNGWAVSRMGDSACGAIFGGELVCR